MHLPHSRFQQSIAPDTTIWIVSFAHLFEMVATLGEYRVASTVVDNTLLSEPTLVL